MSSLKDLNLKEVSAKTQLEMDFLKAVVDKDFKKLSKFNVRGFLKILSREYELDFTEFLEEYDAFLKDDLDEKAPANSQKEVYIPPQIDSYSAPTGSKSWIFIFILAILIAAAWAVYKYDLLSLLSENNASSNETVVIDIIDEAKNNISAASNESTLSITETSNNALGANHNAQDNLSNNATNSSGASNSQSPQEEVLELVVVAPENNQSSAQSEEEAQNLSDTIASLNQDENLNKEATFNTKGKVWVGFIDLKTNTKTTKVTDVNFSVDLSKDQLILAGATELSVIDENGVQKTYPAGASKRFLVQSGHIKPITLNEFMALNKGKEW